MNPTEHWTGQAGTDYHKRQEVTLDSNVSFFMRALMKASPRRALEFGCGAGLNMAALRHWAPDMEVQGVEINAEAARQAMEYGRVHVQDACNPVTTVDVGRFDVTFTKGMLIHIPPHRLTQAYLNLFTTSRRWILIAEYYNPTPVEVPYRGQAGLLWKRDFAGEMLDTFKSLRLIDYGFTYHRDVEFPQDDISWFLMEKRQ